MAKVVVVDLKKSKLKAFVRLKAIDAESHTFEIRFSEPILESILDSLAAEMFGTGYDASEYYFLITFKKLEHEKCCEILANFLEKLDQRLSEVVIPVTHALSESFRKLRVG